MNEALILVVDDNREIREFLRDAVLLPAGYQVRVVRDGLSALTLAREVLPALVITDQQMPSLDGIELTRRLKHDFPSIPVILITGESTEQLAVEALRAGVSDYFIKPFSPDELLDSIARILQSGQRQQRERMQESFDIADDQALQRRVHELETLEMVGRTVTAMLDLDDVLTAVVEAAVRVTDADEGSLLLLDEDSGELYMRASKNFDEEFARTFRLKVQDSLAGKVMETGKPVVLDESTPKKIKTAYLVHSLIYVPLSIRNHTIGVLGVDNRRVGSTLTSKHITILMAMANYAAIAIENAKLYQRSENERRRLGAILNQIKNAVLVVDPDKRVLLINPTGREAFSIQDDPMGREVAEVINHTRLLELIQRQGQLPLHDEIELKDGRVFDVQGTLIEGLGKAIVMQDITHLKELDRIKSDFVTAVSHDLRSPLTAILGYAELIERVGDVNEKQHEFIRRVKVSVQQITCLVTDLLDLGKIEAGLDSTKEPTPIAMLANEVADNLRGVAEAKGIHLEVKLPKESPIVFGAPARLRQMISNLLDNATKYSLNGGTIWMEIEAEQDQVILKVKDNGPGIPTADLPYLFDKFYRASNAPEDLPGTGLGLSIVKSIVDNHNGRVWVDSRIDEGTTFSVVLPLEKM